MESKKPRQFWNDYASRFKNRSMAISYQYRPPYPAEINSLILNILGESRGSVLDVGCGTGKIARSLVNHVESVDAVDFSHEMIRVGKTLKNGDHQHLHWIIGHIEDVQLYPPYAMVIAGASIHWMEWSVVFPLFAKVLKPNGYVVIIDGDRPIDAPWQEDELSLIRKYSTNKHYEEIDIIQELVDREHLQLVGDEWTTPVNISQSHTHYIQSFHSRESLSIEEMGMENVRLFQSELSEILSDHVDSNGSINFHIVTRVSWGIPLS